MDSIGSGESENGLMRISSGIIQRSSLANLQLNMRGKFAVQEAASTSTVSRRSSSVRKS